MQMMARIKYIIGDEIKSRQMIQYTNRLKQDKKAERLNGKDYLSENVEKASVWHEIYQQNMHLRGAGRDVETEMVWQRK